MAEKGARQVPLVALDDKREITALLSVSMSGCLLAPQTLYSGTTERCHPSAPFPSTWDIWHSKSHWSTTETMLRYVEKIVEPYLTNCKKALGLPQNQKALCIFDVYAAHRNPDLLSLLKKHDVMIVFVPASCTSELQPLDLTFNDAFKKAMKNRFSQFYSSAVCDGLTANNGGALQKVDLTLSKLKPLHAQWMIDVLHNLASDTKSIRMGFEKAGILIRHESEASDDDADTEPYLSDTICYSEVAVTKKSNQTMVMDCMECMLRMIESKDI